MPYFKSSTLITLLFIALSLFFFSSWIEELITDVAVLVKRFARRNRIRVKLSNGQIGTIDKKHFDPKTMEKL